MSDLNDVKLRILTQVPLRQLIGERVELSKRSSLTMGRCPFHDDSSPSFVVYDDHYHCFGCRAHGDAITYVRHVQGLSFVEALRFLAQKYQIPAPELDRSQQDDVQQRRMSSLYRAMAAAQDVFVSDLQTDLGRSARQYLLDRGFTTESIQDFGFGFARDSFHHVIEQLGRKGFRPDDLLRCSLATSSEKTQRPFAFFRSRLMIPIRDSFGRIIGFGGRTLSNDPAKYINSKESELYDKSRTLFGLDRAKESIRRRDSAVMVEGYMDAMQLWQHGFPETIACLGTALTLQQLTLLANFCKRVTIIFDGDAAGNNAMLRTVLIAQQVPQLEVRVAVLPEGDDPDTYVRKVGHDGFRTFLNKAESLLDFAITRKIRETHTLGKAELIENELFPWVLQVREDLKKTLLLQRIAQLSGIPFAGIQSNWQRWQHQQQSQPANQAARAATSSTNAPTRSQAAVKFTQRELEVFGHLYFAEPSDVNVFELRPQLLRFLQLDDAYSGFLDEILEALAAQKAPRNCDRGSWFWSSDTRIQGLLEQLERRAAAFSTTQRRRALETLLRAYAQTERTGARSQLRAQLMNADPEQQRQILSTIAELNKEIADLESNKN